MSNWGIAHTAPEIEKIKAESADYLRGLNCCGSIDWNVYDRAFDFYMDLIDKAYAQGKKDAQPEIIRCKDCDWWTKQGDSLQGRCDRYGTYPTGYWYCAAARERREDG